MPTEPQHSTAAAAATRRSKPPPQLPPPLPRRLTPTLGQRSPLSATAMKPRFSQLLFLSVSLLVLLLPSVAALTPSSSTASASASDVLPWRGDVLNLDDGNFLDNLRGREVVVNFFAPWCSACTQFKPVYEAWAGALARHAEPRLRRVAVAKVDCILNPQTSSSRQIAAFPSVHFYRDGVLLSEYLGERTPKDLVEWVRKHARQSSSEEDQADRQAQQQQQQQQQSSSSRSSKPPSSSSASAGGGASMSSLLSDFDLFSVQSWSDPSALRALLDRLLEFPLIVFRGHPYMALAILYTIGLFQGLFVGIIWALREKR